MNTKVVMISDFDERAWAIEDTLRQFTDSEIVWMSSATLGKDRLSLSSVDVVIIDSSKLDLREILLFNSWSSVILLIDGDDDPLADFPFPPNIVALRKDAQPLEILRVFQPLLAPVFEPLDRQIP